MPRKAISHSPEFKAPDEREPFTFEGPVSGAFDSAPIEAADDGTGIHIEPDAPKRRRARKPKVEVVQKLEEMQPPDPMLMATCSVGITAAIESAEKYLDWSNPGEKWRATMADLTARWIEKLESDWMKTHPIESALVIHSLVWIVPNTAGSIARMITRRKKSAVKAESKAESKANGQSSNIYLRQKENGENAEDATGTSRAS